MAVRAEQAVEALLDDATLMASHAAATGRTVPTWCLQALLDGQGAGAARLARAHNELSRLVAPATPRSLRYLRADERGRSVRGLRVPFVARMSAVATAYLLAFVLLAAHPDVAGVEDLTGLSGSELLLNELLLLVAAGLGACFACLYQALARVADFSFDPRYESSYWVRLMLGSIAGLVVAQLVPFGEGSALGKPLLALLGGFSVQAVYRLLDHLVKGLEALVEPRASQEAVVERERARAEQQLGQARVATAQQLAQVRAALASSDVDGAVAGVDALLADLSGALPVAAEPVPSGGPGEDGEPPLPEAAEALPVALPEQAPARTRRRSEPAGR